MKSGANPYEIEQSTEFSALSAYISEITANPDQHSKLSDENVKTIRILLNNLLEYIAGMPRDFVLMSQYTDRFSIVFHLISLTFDLLMSKANEEEPSARLEEMQVYQRSLLLSICQNLGIPETKTQFDFITYIKSIQNSRDELVYNLIQTFNLPATTTPSDIVRVLKERFMENKNGNYALTNNIREVENLKTQLLQKENALNEKRSKISELTNKVNELQDAVTIMDQEDKTKTQQLTQLQSQLSKIQAELDASNKKNVANKKTIDQLKKDNQDLQIKNLSMKSELDTFHKQSSPESKLAVEITTLKKKVEQITEEKDRVLAMLDDLATQLEQQAEELNQETDSRMQLIVAVQKLTAINEILEKELEKSKDQIEKLEKEKESLPKPHESAQHVLGELISKLKETTSASQNEEINNIFDDSEKSQQDKIIEAVNKLVSLTNKKEEVIIQEREVPSPEQSKAERALKGMITFIQEMAESGNITKWAPEGQSPAQARMKLLGEIRRINEFIEENAVSQFEESSFIEYLGLNANITDFQTKANEVLAQNSDSEDPKDLYDLLTFSVIANDVLRRYASQAKMTVTHLSSTLKSSKAEAKAQLKAMEDKHYAEKTEMLDNLEKVNAKNEELTKTVKTIKTALQNSAAREECADTNTLIDCIQNINAAMPELNENDYINELEKVLRQKTNDYKQLKEETDQKIDDLEGELEHYKQVLATNKEKAIEMSAQQLNEIEKIRTSLAESEELIGQLQEQKAKLEAQIEESKDDIIKATAELRKQLFNTKNELDALHDEHEQKVHSLTSENEYLKKTTAETKATAERHIANIKKSLKKKVTLIAQQASQKQAEFEEVIVRQKTDIENLQSQLEEMENSQIKMQEELDKVIDEKKEKENELAKAGLEQKLLKTKLTSFSDKLKRNNSVFESQMKLKLFAMETDNRAKLDAMKSECSKKIDMILNQIYSTIEDFDEEKGQRIDEDVLSEIIGKVADIARTVPELKQGYSQIQDDFSVVREAFGIPRTSKTSAIAKEIVTRHEENNKEISNLSAANKQMKKELIGVRALAQQEKINNEWENWARKLHLQIADGEISIKGAREIRQSIEDLVLASCNNKSLWTKLECLRDEKKLILCGANNFQKKSAPTKIQTLTTVFNFLTKIQKMSGYNYGSDLSLDSPVKTQSSVESIASIPPSKPKSPIFSQFVRNAAGNENVNQN